MSLSWRNLLPFVFKESRQVLKLKFDADMEGDSSGSWKFVNNGLEESSQVVDTETPTKLMGFHGCD